MKVKSELTVPKIQVKTAKAQDVTGASRTYGTIYSTRLWFLDARAEDLAPRS